MIGQSLDILKSAFSAVGQWFGMSVSAVSATSLVIASVSALAVYRFIIMPLVHGRVGGSDMARKKEKE